MQPVSIVGEHRGFKIYFECISYGCESLSIRGETSERKVKNQIDRILDRPRTQKEKKLSEAFKARALRYVSNVTSATTAPEIEKAREQFEVKPCHN
jgi:hypothetical protein